MMSFFISDTRLYDSNQDMQTRYLLLAVLAGSYPLFESCTVRNFAATTAGSVIIINNADLPSGTVGHAYEARLSARGGVAPYSWGISKGNLPAGLTLNASTGVILGTPITAGWSDFFTIRVQDRSGDSSSLSYSAIINPVLDEYGGSPLLPCRATGWFHTEKIGDRWLFCDPAGNASFRIAVGGMLAPGDGRDPHTGQSNSYQSIATGKYGDLNAHWGPQQVRRIRSWGFNTIGQLSSDYVQPYWTCQDCSGWRHGDQPVKVPTFEELLVSNYAAYNRDNLADRATKDLGYGLNYNYSYWRAPILDFFDKAFEQWTDAYFSQSSMQSPLSSRWILGISIDDSDYLWGLGAGPDFVSSPRGHTSADIAYMAMITSPMQTFNPNPMRRGISEIYLDSKVYSKVAVSSPPATCSITTPCSLRDYLYKKYKGNIQGLNTAWETHGYYTTFDSSGTPVQREVIGTGDGITTSFEHTLARTPVSPESVLIQLNGKAQGGDCPWWIDDCKMKRANSGTIEGPAQSTVLADTRSTVDYSSGQLTIIFKSAPPAGQKITANYVAGGWMHGTGLMDEDGRHTAWLGNNSVCLSPATACDGSGEPLPNATRGVAADLDGWISEFSAQYFRSCKTALKKHAPQIMYFGADTLGTWGVPPRKEVLEGAAPYIDGIVPAISTEQASTDYVARYLGDKPMFATLFCAATPDSALSRYPGASAGVHDFATQELRGQIWQKDVHDLFNLKASSTSTYPYIGVSWWGLVDFWNEKTNWGLVSLNDNPYDGKSAVRTSRTDAWGYGVGDEEKNYGDAIDYVKKANVQWFVLLKRNPAVANR
jgi:hypothetical protein